MVHRITATAMIHLWVCSGAAGAGGADAVAASGFASASIQDNFGSDE
jgi:hypothetical protein